MTSPAPDPNKATQTDAKEEAIGCGCGFLVLGIILLLLGIILSSEYFFGNRADASLMWWGTGSVVVAIGLFIFSAWPNRPKQDD